MSEFLYGSICLSKIPKELITKDKQGNSYLNIAISKRKEVSQYGDTHTIVASVKKEDRKDGEKPIYIGNLKEWNNHNNDNSTKEQTKNDDGFPF